MQLIKEHLIAKGLTKTVSLLEQELLESENSIGNELIHSNQSQGLKTPHNDNRKRQRDSLPPIGGTSVLSSSHPHQSSPYDTNTTTTNAMDESTGNSTNSIRKLKRMLSPDIVDVSGNRSNTSTPIPDESTTVITTKSSTSLSSYNPAISKAQRKRNLKRALKQPYHASIPIPTTSSPYSPRPTTTTGTTSTTTAAMCCSPLPSTSTSNTINKKVQIIPPTMHTKHSSNNGHHVHSKLHSIMNRYLKIQHSQCKHPITTLPILSLQKPHYCSKPTLSPYSNIMNIVNRHSSMRDTWQYSHQKYDIYGQRLQYIYSAYRPIRTLRQIDSSSISATSFCSDPSKMWISYYDDWQNDGPGIALVDVSSGMELCCSGLDEIDGIISKLTLSPKTFTTNFPFILTSITNFYQYQNFYLEHDLYLWKDTSLDPTIDTEVFDQRYVQHFKVYANGTDDDDRETLLFTSEAFNPSGRQIAALHAGADSVSGVNDNGMSNTCTAYILDVETGAVLQTIANTGNENTYLVPTLNYVNHDENLLIMDGKLYDIRQSTNVLPIHRFDKLSFAGNTAIHPYKYEIIIDNAIWDLRNCSILKQTVPLLDNCKVKFDGTGNVLFGYRSLDEERDDLKLNMNHSVQDNNFFHVLNAQDYSHLHTESIEKENMLLWDLDVDRYGAGYLSTLMFSNHFSESMCRIFEIGKRKKTLGDGDSDDEEDEDDNDADWDSQQDGIDEDMDTVHGDDDDDDDDDSNGTDESDADDDIDDSTVEDSDDEMEIIIDDDDDEEEDDDDNYEDFDEDDEDDEDYSPAGEGRQNEDDEDGWETMSEEDI